MLRNVFTMNQLTQLTQLNQLNRPMRETSERYAEGQLIVDPNAEEEALMEAVVSVALSESGEVVGVFKPGGTVEAGAASMTSVHSLVTCMV